MVAEANPNEPAAVVLKAFLACMPVSIVVYRFHIQNHFIIGLSLVAGVLLQALIPPRKKGMLLLLTAAIVYALFYSLMWKTN